MNMYLNLKSKAMSGCVRFEEISKPILGWTGWLVPFLFFEPDLT